jgi:hypothetical protein
MKEAGCTMAEHNGSRSSEEIDSEGMTDAQYKGWLLDQLQDWQDVLDMAIKAENTEIQKKVETQIATINKKLQF